MCFPTFSLTLSLSLSLAFTNAFPTSFHPHPRSTHLIHRDDCTALSNSTNCAGNALRVVIVTCPSTTPAATHTLFQEAVTASGGTLRYEYGAISPTTTILRLDWLERQLC
ncbi:hypothetical protein BU16DRAFT_554368 [Lophium mytilinum]|uniref:Secreted protein n=1 Tax=Lophium mytilinum TaxID=390894 RepID=A0A6A6RD34_9PEZI|nr:hypothetical protein BU16DRAFT_554368 [Lophium mytilinum]